jgi:hypothetical protein
VTVARNTVDDAVAIGWQRLLDAHTTQWAALWRRRVTVAGQPSVQNAVNSSFYLLYSSLRAGVNFSIPPAGLSSDNYAGLIFWDADTWMFPTLLALHPELARSIVMFRYDTIGAAEANARRPGPCANHEDHLPPAAQRRTARPPGRPPGADHPRRRSRRTDRPYWRRAFHRGPGTL